MARAKREYNKSVKEQSKQPALLESEVANTTTNLTASFTTTTNDQPPQPQVIENDTISTSTTI